MAGADTGHEENYFTILCNGRSHLIYFPNLYISAII